MSSEAARSPSPEHLESLSLPDSIDNLYAALGQHSSSGQSASSSFRARKDDTGHPASTQVASL